MVQWISPKGRCSRSLIFSSLFRSRLVYESSGATPTIAMFEKALQLDRMTQIPFNRISADCELVSHFAVAQTAAAFPENYGDQAADRSCHVDLHRRHPHVLEMRGGRQRDSRARVQRLVDLASGPDPRHRPYCRRSVEEGWPAPIQASQKSSCRTVKVFGRPEKGSRYDGAFP